VPGCRRYAGLCRVFEKSFLMTARRGFSLWGPVGAYAALIFFLSSLKGSRPFPLFPHGDKVLHALLYLPFGFLTLRAARVSLGHRWLGALLGSFFVVSLYALSDEVHQLFVPGRTFSLWDWGADLLGAAAGIWLCYGKDRTLSQSSL